MVNPSSPCAIENTYEKSNQNASTYVTDSQRVSQAGYIPDNRYSPLEQVHPSIAVGQLCTRDDARLLTRNRGGLMPNKTTESLLQVHTKQQKQCFHLADRRLNEGSGLQPCRDSTPQLIARTKRSAAGPNISFSAAFEAGTQAKSLITTTLLYVPKKGVREIT